MSFSIPLVFTGCKNDGDDINPSADELQTENLAGSNIGGKEGSVTRDDTPLNEWDDFTIFFTNQTYPTTNTNPNVRPEGSPWSFVEGKLDRIQRIDGLIFDIPILETTLGTDATVKKATDNGQVMGITGNYHF